MKKLVEARIGLLGPEEKGVVYCASHIKCRALARLLGCHYYYGVAGELDIHFLAQREAGF